MVHDKKNFAGKKPTAQDLSKKGEAAKPTTGPTSTGNFGKNQTGVSKDKSDIAKRDINSRK